ncbi:MAG: hypothetical protein ACHQ7M_12755, partial [Chloroflexota bacterium]
MAGPAEQVWRLPPRINDAWLKGSIAVLVERFHEDMGIAGRDLQSLASGREACSQSCADFASSATIRECRLSEPRVSGWGGTA